MAETLFIVDPSPSERDRIALGFVQRQIKRSELADFGELRLPSADENIAKLREPPALRGPGRLHRGLLAAPGDFVPR